MKPKKIQIKTVGRFTYNKYDNGREEIIEHKDELVMENRDEELQHNMPFIKKARGDVLIGGFGLGFVIEKIAHKVDSITVVEKDPDILKLMNHKELPDNVFIIVADIFKVETNGSFDVIYIDIWNGITERNYKDMIRLKGKFKNNLKPDGEILFWLEDKAKEVWQSQ